MNKADVLTALVLGLLIVFIYVGLRHLMTRPPTEQQIYLTRCIIENKELPQPDLYCQAMWDTTKGQGGR